MTDHEAAAARLERLANLDGTIWVDLNWSPNPSTESKRWRLSIDRAKDGLYPGSTTCFGATVADAVADAESRLATSLTDPDGGEGQE